MPNCPYRRCAQRYPTQAAVEEHLTAVPAGDADHQPDELPLGPIRRHEGNDPSHAATT